MNSYLPPKFSQQYRTNMLYTYMMNSVAPHIIWVHIFHTTEQYLNKHESIEVTQISKVLGPHVHIKLLDYYLNIKIVRQQQVVTHAFKYVIPRLGGGGGNALTGCVFGAIGFFERAKGESTGG